MNENAADQVHSPPQSSHTPDTPAETSDAPSPSQTPISASNGSAEHTPAPSVPPGAPEVPSSTSVPPQPIAQPAPPVTESANVALDAETEAEIAKAMQEATSPSAGEGPSPVMDAALHTPELPDIAPHEMPAPEELEAAHAAAEKRPIRGPRVVQGGREHRTGLVVSVGPSDIFIEFGPRELGVLPRTQFKDDETLPVVTNEIEVVVERYDAAESLYLCSRPGAVQKADWELLQTGQIVEARVTGKNKGGLELEVAKHRAFMPASQIDVHRIDDLSVFIGEKMQCKVIRVDRSGRGNITLSRRDLVAEERKQQFEKLKETLAVGQTVEGIVRKIMPFGAFVDIGGVDGLLHVSDLSHDRTTKVENVVKEGDAVNVQVLKLDWDNNRHSLGLKQLQEDPWTASLGEIKEGDELTGTVKKLMEFGAFIEIAPGVEGLAHISELSWQRVQKSSDVVQPGKVVKVKVLKLDADTRKISLSMKQCSDNPVPKGMKKTRGKGRRGGEVDTRSADEILKETPALRRAREQAKKSEKEKGLKSGLGDFAGSGLGDLKLPS